MERVGAVADTRKKNAAIVKAKVEPPETDRGTQIVFVAACFIFKQGGAI